ncbi:hypothetical protein K402DRAFT_215863 [Aulographum hederae CBS 113979]|uniref:Dynamin family protein n=1 Tax=Aulographum hederae CBS 113979 TaxID=1176131 RepID=A0A6G1GM18_9PEZI|nr:hypothetical protein K402DRAFT_215863 [Aulographum hederae CBS 113979]
MMDDATTPTTIDNESLNNSSLEALQNEDMRQIMDMVDKMRRNGLGGVLQLPQLVVCGDQSSGKSSVLEAITEIPFPRKENLCTRFATEIILRREKTTSISTRIIPDKGRPSNEQAKLQDFKKSISGFEELPALIEEATKLMGLEGSTSSTPRAFSRDVLSIEISGPGRSQLTLVDLPGLIHSENKSQSKEDVELIRSLVGEYIENKRTIILAVVSAKNDYANQIILKSARDVDEKGNRTLGIITKPDFLEPASENELSWIELAQNKDIFFELGWHMLKNRSPKEIDTSFQTRNASESMFFSKGRYRDIKKEDLGIDSLRVKLSALLYSHLKKELPSLQQELELKYSETVLNLERLGESRQERKQQKRYLTQASIQFTRIAEAAVDGHYEHKFFGHSNVSEAIHHVSNLKRLRAIVQHLNMQFSRQMGKFGAKYKIAAPDSAETGLLEDEVLDVKLDDAYSSAEDQQTHMKRSHAIKWVQNVLQRSRGRELPGNFNPLLISELFWEQSEHWEGMARDHIHRVALACERFVKALVNDLVSPDVAGRLLKLKVDDVLAARLRAAEDELDKIITDKGRHPITYNHYYTTTIQKLRNKKSMAKAKKLADQHTTDYYCDVGEARFDSVSGPTRVSALDPEAFMKNFEQEFIEQDMDKFSAEDALDCEMAYYKDELKYFVGVITKQVIERYLVHNLGEDTLSPLLIGEMTDDEIHFIAAEPGAVSNERRFLEDRKKTLEMGQKAFRGALEFMK